ncbi:MAG: hypothetical protein LBO00_08395 [Zoogloeaceae bacterium]|jgi:hypothetical protein|nr:hypothetical protein [Zoogloeaceae bacterium]
MSSIIKLPNGKYRAALCINGRRPSKVFPTRDKAQAWAAETEYHLRSSIAGNPVGTTRLVKIMERYLAQVTPNKRSPRTERSIIHMLIASKDFPSRID